MEKIGMNLGVAATALAVALCFAAYAAPFAESVTCEAYPDADSVVVDESERVSYNPDGTYETHMESWTKILTEKGRREESSVSLHYSKRYGEAEISYVGAISPDGKEREIDVSATTKESTDNGSMSANIYDPLDRKIVCTIPGLKIGDTVHVKTRRKALKARCENKWADLSVMEWSHPIVKSTFEVTALAALPLRKIAIRHPLGNVVTNLVRRTDGSTVYTFTATNSPQAFPEPDMPPLYTQIQCVRVSTAESWPEISKWYWNLCAPHISKTNAAMAEKVKELGGDLRKVFKFVSQEVRYMGLTMEDTSPGYAPHDVDITFDNRYGVCRDKAGLLVAMLRLAGHKAFPVLIHVGAKLDPDVPQPFFNHAIVAVEKPGGGYELMDPTNENAKDLFPAYLSNCSCIVCRPEGDALMTSPVPWPEHNSLDVTSKASLAKDGSLFLENEIRMNGINDTAYRHALVKRKPEDRVKFFEQVVKALASGSELVKCEIEPKDMRDTDAPIVVRLASKLPEAALRGETLDELNVPFVTKSLGMANFLLRGNTSLAQRRFPLVLDSTARVSERITVDLGGAVGAVKSLPAAETGGIPGYKYARVFSETNGTLRAERSVEIGEIEFSPAAYLNLREEIKRTEAAERKRPAFSRDPLAEADVRYVLDSSETTVISDSEWVTTNTIVKEILTYNGKKRSAELKFPFNPAWKTVELVSAVVSNKNGKVSPVTAKEKNLMDCGWASNAPRYPAGKLLVVNLPSVEIGSVISYTTVTTVTNAPAPFYGAFSFDSREPLERRVVRVNGWRREAVRPRRVPNEPSQPAASLWRDCEIVSFNDFAKTSARLVAADPPDIASDEPSAADAPSSGIRAIRDWMAKYVKVLGPSLYELPVELQLTDPTVVLKERYGTGLDYIRTMCALMRRAGYEADVVFASSDADDPPEVRERIKFIKPNVRAFSIPLCRVRVRSGGFLWLGGERSEIFIGPESQYAQLGATRFEGSDYLDPATGEFGVVTVPAPDLHEYNAESSVYSIRPDGSVDLDVENTMLGPSVASFRKTYAEILPEERQRRYQAILGGVSQAATATRELETDVESYPAKRTFSCYIPDFATVGDGTMTIQVPPLSASVPSITGTVRLTPFEVGSAERESESVTIRFPEGYTEAEHLPEPFVLRDPRDATRTWVESRVSSEVKDGALEVRLVREIYRRPDTWYPPEYFGLLKDWLRTANSRANRTVTARRPAKGGRGSR